MRKPRDHPQSGSQLIEMAFVLPLLLLLLAGVLDVGRAFNKYIIITNASREGARVGTRTPCMSGVPAQRQALKDLIITTVIAEAADSGLTLNVTIAPDPVTVGCGAAGSPLRVTVSASFATVMGAFVGASSFTLRNYTEMAIMGNEDTRVLPAALPLVRATLSQKEEGHERHPAVFG